MVLYLNISVKEDEGIRDNCPWAYAVYKRK